MKSLKKKSISAVLWTVMELFFKQIFKIAVAVFLARLLSPEEFGTLALLSIFIGVANILVEGGFAAALVQKQDVSDTDASTVFWFNCGIGAIMAGFLYLIAPYIAHYYDKPILKDVMVLISLSVFISSLGGVQHALLTKKLEFKTPMKAAVTAAAISGASACYLAVRGLGIWALAWQALINSGVYIALLWMLSDWRPKWLFSLTSLTSLFKFGGFLMLSGLLNTVYSRLYTLLIGQYYHLHDLGIFDRAKNTQQIPVGMLSLLVYRVAFPLFSAAATDKERLKRGVRLAVHSIMLVNVPVMLGLMVTADKVVLIMFGPQWSEAIPFLEILCLVGVMQPLQVINLNVLKALGYSNLFFRLEILKKVVGTVFILIGINYGVLGLAWGMVVSSVVAFWINAYYTKYFLNYGVLKQVVDILPIILISIIMVACIGYVSSIYVGSDFERLLVDIFVGIAVYLILSLMFNYKAIVLFINILQKKKVSP